MDADRSFVEFTRTQYAGLVRTAALLTTDMGSAEDLVQETLAKLYPVWWRVDAADHPLAYVRRCLTNAFVSSRRRASATEIVVATVPDAPTRLDASEGVVDRGLTVQLLSRLSDRQRAAIVLRYYHDLTDDEIAAHLDCRRATARSLVSRGLAAMREETAKTEGVRSGTSGGDRT